MSSGPTNPWHILGAQPDAPMEDVQRNYRALVAVWTSLQNEDQLAVLEGAWLFVSNPACCAAYEGAQTPKPAAPAGGVQAAAASSSYGTAAQHPIVLSAPATASQTRSVTQDRQIPPPTPQPVPQLARQISQPTAAVAVVQPAGASRKDSARKFISDASSKQEKYAEDMTKAQRVLDHLHQEIFAINFVHSLPPQPDGHQFYSHSNFAGLGKQARSANDTEMLQRRVLEQTKEAEINKVKAAYTITHTDFEALNKQVYSAKFYLGDEGRAEEAKKEMMDAGEKFRSWLVEFEDRDAARQEGGNRLKRELEVAQAAHIEQHEKDRIARIEFERRAARVIAGEENNMSLDEVMALHPNGYGRDRMFDRSFTSGGRAGPGAPRRTAEEQAYEDRLNAAFASDSRVPRRGFRDQGGRGGGGGMSRGGIDGGSLMGHSGMGRGGDYQRGGDRGGRGDRGGSRGGSGMMPIRPRSEMTKEELEYEDRLAYLDRNMDSLFPERGF